MLKYHFKHVTYVAYDVLINNMAVKKKNQNLKCMTLFSDKYINVK